MHHVERVSQRRGMRRRQAPGCLEEARRHRCGARRVLARLLVERGIVHLIRQVPARSSDHEGRSRDRRDVQGDLGAVHQATRGADARGGKERGHVRQADREGDRLPGDAPHRVRRRTRPRCAPRGAERPGGVDVGVHHITRGGEGVPRGVAGGWPARPPDRHSRQGHGEDPRRALRHGRAHRRDVHAVQGQRGHHGARASRAR